MILRVGGECLGGHCWEELTQKASGSSSFLLRKKEKECVREKKYKGAVRKRSRKSATKLLQYPGPPLVNPFPPPQLNELLKEPNQSCRYWANNNWRSLSRWLHLSIWWQHMHNLPSAHSCSNRGQPSARLPLQRGGGESHRSAFKAQAAFRSLLMCLLTTQFSDFRNALEGNCLSHVNSSFAVTLSTWIYYWWRVLF